MDPYDVCLRQLLVNSAHTSLVNRPQPRRYQTDIGGAGFAAMTVQQHIDYAATDQVLRCLCVPVPRPFQSVCRGCGTWRGLCLASSTWSQLPNPSAALQTQQLAAYIQKGGLPPVIGEWAPAGDHRHHVVSAHG